MNKTFQENNFYAMYTIFCRNAFDVYILIVFLKIVKQLFKF